VTSTDIGVLLFGTRRLPRALRDRPVITLDDVTACRRVVVVGSHADLSQVLTTLMRAERLDVEVAHVRRPWQARRTPRITFSRLNGSVTPLRLTTASTAVSTVVNRRPHSGQDRRRRIACPSSVSRESTTRESG